MEKKYPSQIRYEEKNPAITFRVKKDEEIKIKMMSEKAGRSVSELVRMALLDLEKDFKEALKQERLKGFEEGDDNRFKRENAKGYDNGMNDWAILVYCYICFKPLFIKRESKDHRKVIDEMKGRLKRDHCPED